MVKAEKEEIGLADVPVVFEEEETQEMIEEDEILDEDLDQVLHNAEEGEEE